MLPPPLQSTDKNLMVPVGGSIVCGPDPTFIAEVSIHIYFHIQFSGGLSTLEHRLKHRLKHRLNIDWNID